MRILAAICLTIIASGAAAIVHAAAGDAGPRGKHWPYRALQRPATPEVNRSDWPANPIDAFILARLEAAGLQPAPPADRRTLIRRAYYDLIGLPPTPEQVRAFVDDNDPRAYEKLIDELLASPHYGEKWGRHWLDLVRYAETNSFERDGVKPNVWRYRDYVIRSFNDDKPYDQFIREQLAGDELDEVTPETLIATGFYRLGLWDDEPADREQAYYDGLDDIVSTTSQVFLAMTLNCARCHEHKADPIQQEDYYRFLAFFRNVTPFSHDRGVESHFNQRVISTPQELAEFERQREEKLEAIEREIAEIEQRVVATFSGPEQDDAKAPAVREQLIAERWKKVLPSDQAKRYAKLLREREHTPVAPPKQALIVTEYGGKPRDTHVLARGSAHAPTEKVEPGYPHVLGFDDPPIPAPPRGAKTLGRRRALAEWIASPRNPLTARVMVNRLWQHHFGRGIVRSTNEFGKLGEKPSHPQLRDHLPTHPKLLDWLAAEFIACDWSIKRMHRLIMTSAAYRMSSADNTAAFSEDPTNDLFWRFNMRRLTAEEIRDSILTMNGSLNLEMFGPWVYTPIPDAVKATASRPDAAWGRSPPDQQVRRSIYVHVKRSLLDPFLASFDSADTDFSCPVRVKTTVPTQSLTMLNSAFVNDHARRFAERLRREAPGDVRAQVRRALSLVTQRDPTTTEIDRGLDLIDRLQADDGMTADQALDAFCLMALNLNEFIYLD